MKSHYYNDVTIMPLLCGLIERLWATTEYGKEGFYGNGD